MPRALVVVSGECTCVRSAMRPTCSISLLLCRYFQQDTLPPRLLAVIAACAPVTKFVVSGSCGWLQAAWAASEHYTAD